MKEIVKLDTSIITMFQTHIIELLNFNDEYIVESLLEVLTLAANPDNKNQIIELLIDQVHKNYFYQTKAIDSMLSIINAHSTTIEDAVKEFYKIFVRYPINIEKKHIDLVISSINKLSVESLNKPPTNDDNNVGSDTDAPTFNLKSRLVFSTISMSSAVSKVQSYLLVEQQASLSSLKNYMYLLAFVMWVVGNFSNDIENEVNNLAALALFEEIVTKLDEFFQILALTNERVLTKCRDSCALMYLSYARICGSPFAKRLNLELKKVFQSLLNVLPFELHADLLENFHTKLQETVNMNNLRQDVVTLTNLIQKTHNITFCSANDFGNFSSVDNRKPFIELKIETFDKSNDLFTISYSNKKADKEEVHSIGDLISKKSVKKKWSQATLEPSDENKQNIKQHNTENKSINVTKTEKVAPKIDLETLDNAKGSEPINLLFSGYSNNKFGLED